MTAADGGARGAGGTSGSRVAVVSTSWTQNPQHETAVATRSVAGALSRLAAVDVFVPGEGPAFADGAFEVTHLATSLDGEQTRAEELGAALAGYRAVLVEAGDGASGDDVAATCAAAVSSTADVPVLSVGAARRVGTDDGGGRRADAAIGLLAVDFDGDPELDFDGDPALDPDGDPALDPVDAGGRARGGQDTTSTPAVHRVGMYARIDPGAKSRRHYGLGAVPAYLLVLGDRTGTPATPWPSERARWLLARFPREYVVVVEGGAARAWRSRSCVARFEVHTRMDLWILMAQARAVVDLLPGDVFARECVESLRYGVPVAVPAGSAASGFARAGGGLSFSSTAELLSCVEALADPHTRTAIASAGQTLAERWYGDPDGLVRRLDDALALHGVRIPHGAVNRPTTTRAAGTRGRSPSSRA